MIITTAVDQTGEWLDVGYGEQQSPKEVAAGQLRDFADVLAGLRSTTRL
jgi:hypothetical protein